MKVVLTHPDITPKNSEVKKPLHGLHSSSEKNMSSAQMLQEVPAKPFAHMGSTASSNGDRSPGQAGSPNGHAKTQKGNSLMVM
jgi:hypothetical protein